MSGISVTAQARQEPAAVWPGATGSPLLSMACLHARTHATGAEASQPPIAACGRTGRSEAGLVRMQTQSQRGEKSLWYCMSSGLQSSLRK